MKSVGQLNDSGWHGIPADDKASKSGVTKARTDFSIHFVPVDTAGNSRASFEPGRDEYRVILYLYKLHRIT